MGDVSGVKVADLLTLFADLLEAGELDPGKPKRKPCIVGARCTSAKLRAIAARDDYLPWSPDDAPVVPDAWAREPSWQPD
jgi:hypothetical protein